MDRHDLCLGKRHRNLTQSWPTLLSMGGMLLAFALFMLWVAQPSITAQALPEYSAQTGEPCSSCHISPSGGGPRGPRGQAWVGQNRPGYVPGLIEALETLGVTLDVDLDYYQVAPESIPPAQPFQPAASVETEQTLEGIVKWLTNFDGN